MEGRQPAKHYWQRRARIIGMLLGLSFVCAAMAGTAWAGQEADVRMAWSTQELERYRLTHSLVDLRSAVTMMDGTLDVDEMYLVRIPGPAHRIISTMPPQDLVAVRRRIVRGWAQVLKAIEGAYDPTFDPKDRNYFVETGEIDAAAVKANALKIKRGSYYMQVYNLDRLAMTSLSMTLDFYRKYAPDGTPSDFGALDEMLQQAGLSNARRTLLDAMFYARDPAQRSRKVVEPFAVCCQACSE